ncbi:MAG TPA: PilZ domain-containing protein [Anaeromyxobacteraceae bacterium]|nr:PilZ domain-containing protein [Anaeromyxobacteraceae bacterium]
MATVLVKEERREFSRISLNRPAILETAGGKVLCELVDISLRGALVEVPPAYLGDIGQRCLLLIRLDVGTATIRMVGTIVHRDGSMVGVCTSELDIDSATHLRRLVEVNLADDRLLEREIGALVSSRR